MNDVNDANDTVVEGDVPPGLLYSPDHAWVRDEGNGVAAIGMTRQAADAMGKLVYLDLPSPGEKVQAGKPAFDVESAKSISPFISPVTGVVEQNNEDAVDDPAIVNADPYGAWLCIVRIDSDTVNADGYLVDASHYATLVRET